MNLTIGLSGLRVAQQMIELIGTNIANVSTDGYHRQDAVIEPLAEWHLLGEPIGGSQVKSYRRAIDMLLEEQILQQHPELGQTNRELSALQSIESAFGGLDSEGLNSELNEFFGALRELAADPASEPYRQRAVWAADGLASSFRHLGSALETLDDQILKEAQVVIQDVNALAETIAELNGEIERITMRGGSNNLLTDKRDQAILELSDLIGVEETTRADRPEIVDVRVCGEPLVLKTRTVPLQVTEVEGGKLGLAPEGDYHFETDISGGRLGGLFSLRNDLVAEIQDDLDTLAEQLMREINGIHLQGVGLTGSFDRLTGTAVLDADAALADWNQPITSGTMHLRLVAATGEVTHHSVPIDADLDTLNTVAAKLNALDPASLSASVVGEALRLEGKAGCRFDFLPAPGLELGAPWTGTSTPEVSGMYTGSANDAFTFTVQGSGEIGVDADIAVEVRNAAGEPLTTLEVGSGYVVGDRLEVHDGIYVAFDMGTVVDGETFLADVLAKSDPTGFLAAAGIATLFEGDGAADMTVRQEFLDDPRRLATAEGAEMCDNSAVRKMADLGETRLADLGDVSIPDAYRLLVTGVGQKISIRQAKVDTLQGVMQQLENQREEISGVDLNEEAAKLLVFEKMFQGLGKFLSVQNEALQTLIDLV